MYTCICIEFQLLLEKSLMKWRIDKYLLRVSLTLNLFLEAQSLYRSSFFEGGITQPVLPPTSNSTEIPVKKWSEVKMDTRRKHVEKLWKKEAIFGFFLDFQEGALCLYEFLDVKSVNVKKFE